MMMVGGGKRRWRGSVWKANKSGRQRVVWGDGGALGCWGIEDASSDWKATERWNGTGQTCHQKWAEQQVPATARSDKGETRVCRDRQVRNGWTSTGWLAGNMGNLQRASDRSRHCLGPALGDDDEWQENSATHPGLTAWGSIGLCDLALLSRGALSAGRTV